MEKISVEEALNIAFDFMEDDESACGVIDAIFKRLRGKDIKSVKLNKDDKLKNYEIIIVRKE